MGLNIVLISRTPAKLKETKIELGKPSPQKFELLNQLELTWIDWWPFHVWTCNDSELNKKINDDKRK